MRVIKSIYQYRDFIKGSVKREFQAKYQNSLLGATWTILNPLAMIIVYTVVFSKVMHAKLPNIDHSFAYSIYLCAGILTWGLFSEIASRSQNVFLDNANLIKKVNFPRICLPVTIIFSAILNFCIIFGIFTSFLIISGLFPGFVFFQVIPVIIVMIIFAIGLGVTVGVLNVFFRDVGQLFSISLQFWFWFTPIIYPVSILPERLQEAILLNPMTPIVTSFQKILVNGEAPNWGSLVPTFLVGIILVIIGMRLFRTHVGEIVDEI